MMIRRLSGSSVVFVASTMGADDLTYFDIGALVICGASLLSYNIGFFLTLKSVQPPVQLALNLSNAEYWIEKHRAKSDPQTGVLAIQTMRNTIMVAVFIGGYSLSFAYGTLNDYDTNKLSMRLQVRIIILGVLWFGSFLSWACVIRHAAHLGYMIGTIGQADPSLTSDHNSDAVISSRDNYETVGSLEEGREVTEAEAAKKLRIQKYENDQLYLLQKSKYLVKELLVYFSCGFRFMFAAIPFAFYIIGPTALVIATGVMLLFQYFRHDYYYHEYQINDGNKSV